MGSDQFRIELDATGFAGTVRLVGPGGERLPDLVAHRPEAWRFERLARILQIAQSTADRERGQGEGAAMIAAMLSFADYKGDFTAIWDRARHRPAFEAIVTRALTAEGEDEILHKIHVDR
jgi:hypothetical protein